MASVGLHSLDAESQALLCSTLLFGKDDAESLFSFLPPGRSSILLGCAKGILALDRSKRIKLLVTKLKSLLRYQENSALTVIEPSWVVDALTREPPLIVAVILKALPVGYVESLKGGLPREMLLDVEDLQSRLQSEKNHDIFLRAFEKKFFPMPYEELGREFGVHHLLLLQSRDLLVVIREIGVTLLSKYFGLVGIGESVQLLRVLPKEAQRSVLETLRQVVQPKGVSLTADHNLMQQVFQHTLGAEDLFFRFGLYMLASSFEGKNGQLINAIAQRLPMAHGQVLLNYFHASQAESVHQGLLVYILTTVVSLSGRGKIDGRYASCSPLNL